MNALRELLAVFNVDVDTAKLEKAHEKIEQTKGALGALGEGFEKLKLIGEAALVGLGIERFVEGTEQIVEQAVAVRASAAAAGVSTDAYQEWTNTVELAGGHAENLGFLFKTLSTNAYKASQGTKESAQAFKDLGVAFKSSNGELVATPDLMDRIVTKLAAIDNPTKRAALATEILGRGALSLLPLLGNGAEGLAHFREEAQKLGPAFDEDFIKESQEAKEVTFAFEQRILKLKVAIASAFLPVLHLYERTIGPLSDQIAKWLRNQDNLHSTLTALAIVGVPLLISALGGLAGILRVLRILTIEAFLPFAAAALAVAAIQDFIVFLKGGDSVFGAFLNRFGGKGMAQRWRDGIFRAWDEFKTKLRALVDYAESTWSGFRETLRDVARDFQPITEAVAGVVTNFDDMRFAVETLIFTLGANMLVKAVAGAVSSLSTFVTANPALAATTAAILALIAAFHQLEQLSRETEGQGIGGLIHQMVRFHTFDPAKAIDLFQNDEARKRAQTAATAAGAATAPMSTDINMSVPPAVTLNDSRTTNITLPATNEPGAVTRAVDQAVQRSQANDRAAVLAAIAPAGG